jgi:hypothetical protein
MSGVYGEFGQLGIDTVNPVGTRLDFQRSTLGLNQEFIDTNGLRGTRSRSGERVRDGLRRVNGQIVLQPNSLEWASLLAWAMGGTPSGSPTVTYPLGDTLSSRFVTIDKVAKVFTYNGVCVDTMTIKGEDGPEQVLECDLDCVGIDETEANAGTFPALSLDKTTQPFRFYDAVLTLNSTTYKAKKFDFAVRNVIDRDRFFNSQTLVTVQATDRHCAFNLMLPFGDASALYGTSVSGISASIVVTLGGAVMTINFNNVKFPRKTIEVSRPEILVPVEGLVYMTGSTLECNIQLNPGP